MFLKEEGPSELAGAALRQTSTVEPSTSGTSKVSWGSPRTFTDWPPASHHWPLTLHVIHKVRY